MAEYLIPGIAAFLEAALCGFLVWRLARRHARLTRLKHLRKYLSLLNYYGDPGMGYDEVVQLVEVAVLKLSGKAPVTDEDIDECRRMAHIALVEGGREDPADPLQVITESAWKLAL